MIVNCTTLKLFENLSQYEYDDVYYDFHNDYNLKNISLINDTLNLNFKKIENVDTVALQFHKTEIAKFNFIMDSGEDSFTIDNLYRGRADINGMLYEISESGKAYFYLDMYDGQCLEFWSEGIILLHESS